MSYALINRVLQIVKMNDFISTVPGGNRKESEMIIKSMTNNYNVIITKLILMIS